MIQERKESPRLVVTADDFGLSPGVDQGILEAYRRGVVSSTALLLNFPDVADSVARLRQEPGLEVGIHLNLTAGPPVSPPDRVPSLVGADGTFHNFTTFFAKVGLSKIDWGEVAKEWQAQFERGVDLGCRFTFITSHQHVHMLPDVAGICAKLAHEFEVDAIRLSNFRVSEMQWALSPRLLALAPFVPTVRKTLKCGRMFHNTSTLEIPKGAPDQSLRRISKILNRLDGGVHELVCHPGHVDAKLEARDTYVEQRPVELAVLLDAKLRAVIEDAGIKRTTFRELAGRARKAGNTVLAEIRSTEKSWQPAARLS